MIQETNKEQTDSTPHEIKIFKDDALAPKGTTKHVVETDWPVKEAVKQPVKRKKIKKTATARLP